eukprot:scaffold223616_cov36-Tisochrysis_lutea.AAC.1
MPPVGLEEVRSSARARLAQRPKTLKLFLFCRTRDDYRLTGRDRTTPDGRRHACASSDLDNPL